MVPAIKITKLLTMVLYWLSKRKKAALKKENELNDVLTSMSLERKLIQILIHVTYHCASMVEQTTTVVKTK
jgi:hypothetical protein